MTRSYGLIVTRTPAHVIGRPFDKRDHVYLFVVALVTWMSLAHLGDAPGSCALGSRGQGVFGNFRKKSQEWTMRKLRAPYPAAFMMPQEAVIRSRADWIGN
jgi:hypothetical protein